MMRAAGIDYKPINIAPWIDQEVATLTDSHIDLERGVLYRKEMPLLHPTTRAWNATPHPSRARTASPSVSELRG